MSKRGVAHAILGVGGLLFLYLAGPLATEILFGEEVAASNPLLVFYGIAFLVGLVMGGIQSLSRSTYSRLMPETRDTASFFTFYNQLSYFPEKFIGFFDCLRINVKSAISIFWIIFYIEEDAGFTYPPRGCYQ